MKTTIPYINSFVTIREFDNTAWLVDGISLPMIIKKRNKTIYLLDEQSGEMYNLTKHEDESEMMWCSVAKTITIRTANGTLKVCKI